MQCPKCRRSTRPRTRGKAAKDDGLIQAALKDGTCFVCYYPTVGRPRDGVRQRDRHARMRATEQELNTAAAAVFRFWASRRGRGAPAGGLDPVVLERPGLFLMEVR